MRDRDEIECNIIRCENRGRYIVAAVEGGALFNEIMFSTYSCGGHLTRTMEEMGKSVYYVADRKVAEAAARKQARNNLYPKHH